MKNTQAAIYVSLFVLFGFPLVFTIVSFITGRWSFLLFSLIPSFIAGFTGLMVSIPQLKKKQKETHNYKMYPIE